MSTDKERKRPFVSSKSLLNLKSIITQNVTSNNNIEKSNEYKYSSLQQIDHFDEIKKKKCKKSQLFPNQNVLIEYLTKPDLKKFSKHQRIVTSKKQPNLSRRIVIPQTYEQEQINNDKNIEKEINDKPVILQSNTRIVISNNSNDEQHTFMNSKDEESTIISQLPFMCLFDSSFSSCNIKPLLSSSDVSSNSINEEHTTQVHHTIDSWNNHENELKSIQSIDSTLPNQIFINRKVIDSQIEVSPSESMRNQSPTRHEYPQLESVHTPIQESQSLIPSELLDCCESNQRQQSTSIENNSNDWDSFCTSILLHETMINISKRLTKNKSLPIVDTHCHFDLIFDRLYIKHNNLTKYFDDYKDFYPSGLSFELAIQVFWRPRHLTEKNWINWYSKYLNDERIYGSCGIHPHWSSSWKETSIEDIERCLKHPKVVAIGEIGLDFGPKNTCNIDQQRLVFEEQLKLAAKWFKPIVIHSRDAYQQTFNIMKQYLEPNHKIHLHCFVGTMDDVHLFTSYFTEIKFGFTPIISRGNFLHKVIQQLDLTQILSETDSPYFVPEELSNFSHCAHPGMVYSVIEIIAQIQQLSINNVACQLRENARHIYGV